MPWKQAQCRSLSHLTSLPCKLEVKQHAIHDGLCRASIGRPSLRCRGLRRSDRFAKRRIFPSVAMVHECLEESGMATWPVQNQYLARTDAGTWARMGAETPGEPSHPVGLTAPACRVPAPDWAPRSVVPCVCASEAPLTPQQSRLRIGRALHGAIR